MRVYSLVLALTVSAMTTACAQTNVPPVTPDNDTEPVAENTPAAKLDVNDVSILFPLPVSDEDAANLISIADLKAEDGSDIFPVEDFNTMVAISESPASKVGQRQIKLIPPIKDFSTWKIAGIRVDPVAVGASSAVADVFGRSPQIRLVIQPVTVSGGSAVAHDVAFHLIYSYITGREETPSPALLGKAMPDDIAVSNIVADLVALKKHCSDAGTSTDGLLSIHPGLKADVPGLTAEIQSFLERHLHKTRLNATAAMGLNNGQFEPWIFLSMLRQPPVSGQLGPFPSVGLGPITEPKVGHMISFLDSPNIQPAPSPTNRGPMTNNLAIPTPQRSGVSTAVLFTGEDLDAPATIGQDEQGQAVTDADLKNKDIADFIANPETSHFFNTDCASCHTETTRRAILGLEPSTFAYNLPDGVSGLDPDVSPTQRWNVRNFGWFRSDPTITQRTANETAEVVEFINNHVLNQ